MKSNTKELLRDTFQIALFFNEVETHLAIFQSLITELEYFSDRVDGNDLDDPELSLIKKEELKYAYDNYINYKPTIKTLLEKYMVKTKELRIPVFINYFKILQGLRHDDN